MGKHGKIANNIIQVDKICIHDDKYCKLKLSDKGEDDICCGYGYNWNVARKFVFFLYPLS